MLWRQGQVADTFTFVVEGLVSISKLGAGGGETIVGIFGPGDVVGLVAALEQTVFPAQATVISEGAQLCVFLAAPVIEMAKTEPTLLTYFNQAVFAHTRALHAKIDIMSAGTVAERLQCLFQYLARRFGQPIPQDRIVIPTRISRRQLASLVGARIETVIRTLSSWQRKGILQSLPNGFEISVNAQSGLIEN